MKQDAITVRLQGGLGNQLFGWAAGYALAQANNTNLTLDISLLKDGQFALDKYKFSDFKIVKNVVYRPIMMKLPPIRKSIDFFERDFQFDSRFEALTVPTRLNGYFQSWRYFDNHQEKIKTQLNSLMNPSQEFLKIKKSIDFSKVLAVHVRRGDYLNLTNFHGLTSKAYYTNAISLVRSNFKDLEIVVFSDDVEKAKEVINFDAKYIGPNELESPNENLNLMSRAHSIIGSNSSFSWWAAWLNEEVESIIIFPRPWFTNDRLSTIDLLPAKWITLGI